MNTIGQKVARWLVFIIFAIYALSLLFPFFWMLFNSLKTSSQFAENIWGFPRPLTFNNYVTALLNTTMRTAKGEFNILSMFLISVGITVLATIINTLLSSMTAYVVAKYRFFGRNILFSIALFAMILPTAGTLTAQYQLMSVLGLNDSIVGLLVLYSGSFGFTFFIMQGIYKSVSWTYAEAAFMDGASDFRVFISIMMPMARPTMISLGIIYSIGIWNDYVIPSLYLKSIPTLAVGLRRLTIEMEGRGEFSEMFAAMIIAMIPILILFICFQKTIMENTVAGGLKG